MPIPNLPSKHLSRPFFTPHEHVTYFRQHGFIPDFPIPHGVIFCYEPSLLNRITATEAVEHIAGLGGGFYLLTATDNRVAISGNNGIGAPGIAMLLEILIALGVTRFITVGIAGGLQPTSHIGDVVVCTKAVRDEGVSHHYLAEPTLYVAPSPHLTTALIRTLEQHGVPASQGPTWTIDAPFRETVAEIEHYQREGVVTVDMEAAALFAISRFRNVDLTAGFVISDLLAELVWKPQMLAQVTHEQLYRLYEAAHATLLTDCHV